MASIPAYVDALKDAAVAVAYKRGVQVTKSDKNTRVLVLALLTIVAAVVKAIVDKGLLTNAELQATLDLASGDAYPDEPIQPG